MDEHEVEEGSALRLALATGCWRHDVPSEAVRGWPATLRWQVDPSGRVTMTMGDAASLLCDDS